MHYHHALLPALLLAGLPAQNAGKVDFQKHVWPILEANCVECHRASHTDENGRLRRPKGGLILESRKGIEAGRKGKPVIVAGKPEDSELYQMVTLPADDEDRMPPPDEKDPLSKEQTETLRRWITEGAEFGSWIGTAAPATNGDEPTGEGPNGNGATAPVKPDPLVLLAKGVAMPDKAAIQKVTAGGKARVEPVAADSPLLRVSFLQEADKVTDADVAALGPLREHIAILQLGRTSVGDRACTSIARMPRLVRLDLRETTVGDAGLEKLGDLGELRELNLFGTKVGNASTAVLQKLPKLEEVWIWQTAITAEAAVKLRGQKQGLKVNFAPDLPEPEAEQPRDRPRRGR